ncbi:hypothetical protein AURANDRAFT_29960, partial [Aureococcus anophagefferens]
MEIDGDGRWVPFASAKDAGERAWLLEECAKMPCFGELTRRELGVVADAFRLKRFAPGQRVYAEGKGVDYCYVVEEGHASLDGESGFQSQRTVPDVAGKRFFGEAECLDGGPRRCSASAATRLKAWALDTLTMRSILGDSVPKRRLLYLGALRDVPLLASLDVDDKKKIVDGSKGRDHKTGELIVKETEKGDDFFVVLDGSVECTKYVAGANDSVCPTLKKGDFFGELALLKNKNRAATAIALNDVEVLAVPRSLFDALVKPLPALV